MSTTPPTPEPDSRYAYAAWVLSLVSTLGSLFLSDVMELPPCSLCWYQRICLFPLTGVLAVGIVLRDRRVVYYALPLVAVGGALAVFHNLLYYAVIPETLSPCRQGVPCSARQLELLGFIGIPLMSLGAFVSIGGALALHERAQRRAAPPPTQVSSPSAGPVGPGASKWP